MRAQLPTGGEHVAVTCHVPWVTARIAEAADGQLDWRPTLEPTMRVVVEHTSRVFDTTGFVRLSRDAWVADQEMVVHDVLTSGFDMRLRWSEPVPEAVFRWRPPSRTRAAGLILRARSRLLIRAALLQYPVAWVAATRGRAPLHASGCSTGPNGPTLLVGPSGSGKTTLVEEEVRLGGTAVSDNLGIGDGETFWGVVEPVRSDQGRGRTAPHGRRETSLSGRVDSLRPSQIVVLRRGPELRVGRCDPEQAARALIASTYAAGELRRYWQLHALLALGTGLGPPHPPVEDIAGIFADRSLCLSVELPSVRGVRLRDVLTAEGVTAWT